MNQSPDDLDVVAEFRRQLAELPEPPRHARRAPAVAAAAALAAVPAVVVLAGTGASSPALAISRTATTLELRLADASAGARELTRELNAAGIRGRVLTIPVVPARAGTWVVTGEIAGKRASCIPPVGSASVQETVRLSDIENAGSVLRIPVARVRESSGSFVLAAGRAARPGEQAVDLSSPEAVQREVFEPVLGPPPARLPACP